MLNCDTIKSKRPRKELKGVLRLSRLSIEPSVGPRRSARSGLDTRSPACVCNKFLNHSPPI